MRRSLLGIAGLVLAVAPAQANTIGPLSIPAYTALTPRSGSAIATPCTVGESPVPVRTPDAATGRIDGSLGLAVTNCVLAGRYIEDRWKIADSPPELVGKPATVLAVILVDGVQALQSGPGTREASYTLHIDEKEWNVMTVSCEGDSCHHSGNTLGPVMFPLGVTYEKLPATIELGIRREVLLIGPDGAPMNASVGVDVRASLQAVLIRAAD